MSDAAFAKRAGFKIERDSCHDFAITHRETGDVLEGFETREEAWAEAARLARRLGYQR